MLLALGMDFMVALQKILIYLIFKLWMILKIYQKYLEYYFSL